MRNESPKPVVIGLAQIFPRCWWPMTDHVRMRGSATEHSAADKPAYCPRLYVTD